jgi:hypothetical protein|eukprot:TRINITY_DN12452_c2_g1_i1.p1 TRINITY_DN12452_c2_g1~~TRINITY_DN12452_c2_g1_i1.p1  ORF type:complete len:519 (+),score=73.98 TRINITY_DN12452_c2_g1_i1:54-1559(+)
MVGGGVLAEVLLSPSKDHEHIGFLTDPHKWYRHPALRLFVLFMILFMDFFTYGEDPGADSRVLATSLGCGQVSGLLSPWYAPDWVCMVGKLGALVLSIVLAYKLGRLCRKYFFVRWIRWKSFRSDGGNILSCILMFIPSAFISSYLYNVIFVSSSPQYHIDSHSMQFFETVFSLDSTRFNDMGRMWQAISATLDWLSIWQIGDSIIQDTKYWPEFLPGFKRWYTQTYGGRMRIGIYWVGLVVSILLTIWLMVNTGNEPGKLTWEFDIIGGSNEFYRSIFAAVIVFLDLFCLIQDWEFPLFSEAHHAEEDQTKIAGFESTMCEFRVPCCRHRRKLRISQKWLQYGPLVGVIAADFAFVKSQLGYTPQSFGQYVDPHDHAIWSIHDETLLDKVYPLGSNMDPTLLEHITYGARHNATTGALLPGCERDVKSISTYEASKWDYIGVVVAFTVLLCFLSVTRKANHEAIEEHVAVWGNYPEDGDDLWKGDSDAGSSVDPVEPYQK